MPSEHLHLRWRLQKLVGRSKRHVQKIIRPLKGALHLLPHQLIELLVFLVLVPDVIPYDFFIRPNR